MKPILFLLLSHALFAQTPRVSNAKLETRSGANLTATFNAIVAAQDGPAWIAYTVPSTPGNRMSCGWGGEVSSSGPVMLEGSNTLSLLFRVASHTVSKIRVASGECELNAGGLPVIVLTGVRPYESVAFLRSRIEAKNGVKYDEEILALSLHGDPSALEALLDLAKRDTNPKIREKALFWLAQRAGQRETAAIAGAVDNDPDVEVKKKAVFALSQIPEGQGVPKLIEVARANKSPEVRKQAMFWLGQSKDRRALEFFEEVLTK